MPSVLNRRRVVHPRVWHVYFLVPTGPAPDLVSWLPARIIIILTPSSTCRIEEFQRKLQEVRLEADLEQVVITECIKV